MKIRWFGERPQPAQSGREFVGQPVTFRAIPSDPSQPLTVRATFDGVPVERSAKLDAASLQKSLARLEHEGRALTRMVVLVR